jgi:hypothetical protein
MDLLVQHVKCQHALERIHQIHLPVQEMEFAQELTYAFAMKDLEEIDVKIIFNSQEFQIVQSSEMNISDITKQINQL